MPNNTNDTTQAITIDEALQTVERLAEELEPAHPEAAEALREQYNPDTEELTPITPVGVNALTELVTVYSTVTGIGTPTMKLNPGVTNIRLDSGMLDRNEFARIMDEAAEPQPEPEPEDELATGYTPVFVRGDMHVQPIDSDDVFRPVLTTDDTNEDTPVQAIPDERYNYVDFSTNYARPTIPQVNFGAQEQARMSSQ